VDAATLRSAVVQLLEEALRAAHSTAGGDALRTLAAGVWRGCLAMDSAGASKLNQVLPFLFYTHPSYTLVTI
jgi:hypothetical protein